MNNSNVLYSTEQTEINVYSTGEQEEISVDNFAGGGGASTGYELATGKPVTIAINHDPAAIRMHKTNHPYTRHMQTSVYDVDPKAVCKGRPVGIAWFSPDCKHFSRAKGSKPVDKKIRGLAWITLRWAGTVRPRVIILENVVEFKTWGPIRRGKPIKSKRGQTFRKFVQQLEDLGYVVEHRELVAADFGVPTTRKRFFLIARCDGKPVVWPERTHAPADDPKVISGKLRPWRPAAEIIDWSLPCPSIFASKKEIEQQYGIKAKRPLVPNTMQRVARGLDKFTIKSRKPFLVQVNHSGEAFRGQSFDEPMPTVTGKHGYGVADPVLSAWTVTNTTNSTGHTLAEPIDTARTGGGGGQMYMAASLIKYHTERNDWVRGQQLENPMLTIDAANRFGLSAAYLSEFTGKASEQQELKFAHMDKYFSGGYKGCGSSMTEPVPTITAWDHNAAVTVSVAKYVGGEKLLGYWPEIRSMLNKYCDYHLKDDEILLIHINGVAYYICDVGLRMLAPRELYLANGFPQDYVIDIDFMGNEYTKTDQIARCGNAVPPLMATALIRANVPECCTAIPITSMQELYEHFAA